MFATIHAGRAGYEVQVVANTWGTSMPLAQDIALRRMAGEGVILTDTAQCLAGPAQDFSTLEGAQVLQIMTS